MRQASLHLSRKEGAAQPSGKSQKIGGTAQQLTILTTNPLTDPLNLAMCKFIATVKVAGKKAGGRVRVG